MIGFEMAYVQTVPYYLATAQQVIAEEKRGKLHEVLPPMRISLGNMGRKTIENNQTSASPIEHTVVAKFPFDSYIPLHKDALIDDLRPFVGKKVSISGYASPEGTTKYNKRLSAKRAKTVAKIAKNVGVNVSEIVAVGEIECFAKSKKNLSSCRKVEVTAKPEVEHP